jgi:twitching motility protein PilI
VTEINEAYARYSELARTYARQARQLPAQVDYTPTRSAICFRVLGVDLAVFIEEINEILEVPGCTRLPRVKPWVKGVANVRGKLLPIVDLAGFLGRSLRSSPKQQRALLLDNSEVAVGLIVDEVIGMKHFPVNTFSRERDDIPAELSPYVPGAFRSDRDNWLLMRPEQLLNDQRFMDVAV